MAWYLACHGTCMYAFAVERRFMGEGIMVHLRISSWRPEEEGGPEVVASFGCTWQPAFSTRTMQPLRFSDAMR